VAIDLKILFEDNHVLVVNKPAGMLSQGDLSGDLDVLTLAKSIIKNRDNKPGNVFLGLVHRLDRPVAGAMVLAKTSKAAGRLSEQFRKREIKKLYRAVVEGTPSPDENTLKHVLKKDKPTRKTLVVGNDRGGKPAELRYRLLGTNRLCSHVEIQLITGLPHQIRAQLSAIGHPILGDRKYGAKEAPPLGVERGTIALYSHSIGFVHPVKKGETLVTADPPGVRPWNLKDPLFSKKNGQ